VDDLRLVERRGDRQMLDRADVDVTKPAFPPFAGVSCKHVRQVVFENVLLVVGERKAEVEPVGAGGDPVIETDERHEAAERTDGPGVHAEVGPVAAQERAGDEAVPPRCRLSSGGDVGLAPHHRQVGERAVAQRRLDVPTVSVDPAAIQRGEDADDRQVARADPGEGQRFEDGAVPEARLLGHGPDDGMDEGLMGRQDVAGIAGTERRDGAADKRGECDPDSHRIESPHLRGTRGPGVHEHVCGLEQAVQAITVVVVIDVEDHAALAPVEHAGRRRRALPEQITAGRFDPDDVGAVVGQQSGGPRPGEPEAAIDDAEAVERPGHGTRRTMPCELKKKPPGVTRADRASGT
jgi:hypothetical protein